MTEYEQCRSALERLLTWYKAHPGDRNEATTRLHLINQLFLECLGWDKADVEVETPHGKEFADYVFSAPRQLLIVEAKREGVYFELPAGFSRFDYSLTSLCRDYPDLKLALEQVGGYCQRRGVTLGVVCNGHQVVAFIASRTDGTPPLRGKAFVMDSLEVMVSNFLELWNALSKPAVLAGKLQRRLIDSSLPELPPKLASSIPLYPGNKHRNIFQTDLQIVSDLVIEDVARNPELEESFLQECYCQSGALSQYSLLSKEILQAKYAAIFEGVQDPPTPVPAVGKKGISPQILEESLSRRPILLIGDVGVGKTMFIRYLMKVAAAEVFANAVSIYIDFGSQATLVSDPRPYILTEIGRQLRENYGIDTDSRGFVRAVYHLELERFRGSIYSELYETNIGAYREKELEFLEGKLADKAEYLRAALHHVSRGQKKQVVLILDNADQRDDCFQQSVFVAAQEFAQHWSATVFVALRPETFHNSLKRGAISGYHPKALMISPPRVDLVVSKRLQFALKLTDGEIHITSLPANVSGKLHSLGQVIRAFLESLGRNRSLNEFIDNISGGNVRLALNLVGTFFGSGHVDTQKIVDIVTNSPSRCYIIPLHEFVRAVIYGNYEYYRAERSQAIVNLFDISQADPKEHFLLPITVSLLASMSSGPGVNEGFVATEQVYEKLQGLGFVPSQIDLAISRGCQYSIIEAEARRVPTPGEPMPRLLRATAIGLYHSQRLTRQFVYLDAVLVDTPILNPAARESIRDVKTIEERLSRAELMRNYLDGEWGKLLQKPTWFDWSAISLDLQRDIELAREKSKRRKLLATPPAWFRLWGKREEVTVP